MLPKGLRPTLCPLVSYMQFTGACVLKPELAAQRKKKQKKNKGASPKPKAKAVAPKLSAKLVAKAKPKPGSFSRSLTRTL